MLRGCCGFANAGIITGIKFWEVVVDFSLHRLKLSQLLARDWVCVGSAENAVAMSLYNFHLIRTDRNLSLSKELKSI